jgi:hypothetical protein
VTTYEKLRELRRAIVTTAGEIMCYNWGANFDSKQIKGFPDAFKKVTDSLDLSELTTAQMEELGFGKMASWNCCFLIPIWVFPFLPEKLTPAEGF